MKITKICLKEFIGALVYAYDRGADFANLIIEKKGGRDSITLEILEEYMAEDAVEESELNDDILKQLL